MSYKISYCRVALRRTTAEPTELKVLDLSYSCCSYKLQVGITITSLELESSGQVKQKLQNTHSTTNTNYKK